MTLWVDGVSDPGGLPRRVAEPQGGESLGQLQRPLQQHPEELYILAALDAAVASRTTPAATSRWTSRMGSATRSWFGAYDATRWNQAETNFSKIKDAIDNKPLTFDCGCKAELLCLCLSGPTYKVYLCKSFWTAPVTRTDSRASTIVHRAEPLQRGGGHRRSGIRSGQCAQSGEHGSQKALNNADNHEYFAENTPDENWVANRGRMAPAPWRYHDDLLLTTWHMPLAVRAVSQRREQGE